MFGQRKKKALFLHFLCPAFLRECNDPEDPVKCIIMVENKEHDFLDELDGLGFIYRFEEPMHFA